VRSLVTKRHYREAVCAAHDGSDRDRALVGRALDADAGLLAHVQVVTDDELRAALGPGLSTDAVRGELVRVVAQSDLLPLDALDLSVAFTAEGGRAAALPATWETLAWATREALPPHRTTQTYLTGGNVLRGAAAFFTLGFSLLFSDFRPDAVAVEAPLSEYERLAPIATRLHATTERARCSNHSFSAGAGQRCEWYFVLDAVSRDPVTMELTVRYTARRAGGSETEPESCALTRSFRMQLGPPAEIVAQTRARFGDTARPVTELTGP
jgi:hypothetical protein